MKSGFLYIIFSLFATAVPFSRINGQELPIPPVLNLVTVQSETGKAELSWSPSPSPDLGGYIIYYYRNGEGFAFDTIHDPAATNYINYGSFASSIFESYVIAAINSSGDRTSPLSNELHTIFTTSHLDTCKKQIKLNWNKYPSYPKQVSEYKILSSISGGIFTEAGQTNSSDTTFTVNDFTTDSTYCFKIEALLEGGSVSLSNKTCLVTRLQRPPRWINADFATIDTGRNITLSFTFDPHSEINLFRLERKSGSSGTFQEIAMIESNNGSIIYVDKNASISEINSYRLSAINNCGNPVVFSNLASNIVPFVQNLNNEIKLTWNPYKNWLGLVSDYKVFVNTGNSFIEKALIQNSDTVFSISYSEIMYEITGNEICFYISASETGNPHGIDGVSKSSVVCTGTIENIIVPTAFTPNNDLINDHFKPVLSFTPLAYYLVITDSRNNVLFETQDSFSEWDGTQNGKLLPQGVYIWFLKVRTPSDKNITRTGTVTIIRNK